MSPKNGTSLTPGRLNILRLSSDFECLKQHLISKAAMQHSGEL